MTTDNATPQAAVNLYRAIPRYPVSLTLPAQVMNNPRTAAKPPHGFRLEMSTQQPSPFWYLHDGKSVFRGSIIAWDKTDVAYVPEGGLFQEVRLARWREVDDAMADRPNGRASPDIPSFQEDHPARVEHMRLWRSNHAGAEQDAVDRQRGRRR